MKSIAAKLEKRKGLTELMNSLCNKLSGSELNTVLLDVFHRKSSELKPADVLRHYEGNRFVQPAETDYLELLGAMTDSLRMLKTKGFQPVQMSPLAPLGTCSVVGTVDQNKVVSALRGCEVLADVTNALALHVSAWKKKNKHVMDTDHIRFAASQRHVRAQQMNVKGFASHFTIGCMVSAGRDTGDFRFERQALLEQLRALRDVLDIVFQAPIKFIRIIPRGQYPSSFIENIATALTPDFDFEIDRKTSDNNYYKELQYKAVIDVRGSDFEIADGGFVDWTQKLLNNSKERFCITGFGLELLLKLKNGLM